MLPASDDSEKDASRATGRGGRWLLVLALAVGLLVRAAYLCESARAPQVAVPVLDAGFHHAWATAWSTGQWVDLYGQHVASIPHEAYFRPPGYAAFLSGVYRLFGTGGWAPRVAQALLGWACLWVVFWLGNRLVPGAGGWAALVYALYWPAPYYEAFLLDSVWTWTLSALLAAALIRWAETLRSRWLLIAGLTLGACAVIRPNVLLFAPLAAGWVAWRAAGTASLCRTPRGDAPTASEVHGRDASPQVSSDLKRSPRTRFEKLTTVFAAVALLTAATLLPILPVTLRNAGVAHEAVLISSNGGINFYIGNGPYATGMFSDDLGPLGTYDQTDDNVALARGLSMMTGRPVTDRGVGRLLARQALAHLREQPGMWLRLMARKVGFFWGAPEIRLNAEPVADRAASRVLRCVPLSFGILAALGLTGFALLPFLLARQRGAASLSRAAGAVCALLLAAWTVSVTLFFVSGQYRQVVAPLLAVGGGVWLAAVIRACRARRLRAAVFALLLAAVAAVATCRNWSGYLPNRLFSLYNDAWSLSLAGRTGEAEALYQRLIEQPLQLQFSGAPPLSSSEQAVVAKAANALAIRAFRAQDWRRAEERYALSLGYASDPDVLANYGVCLLALGRTREAEEAFARSLSAQPFAEHTRLYYTEALLRNGRRQQAVDELKRLAALHTEVGREAGERLRRLAEKEEK